MSAPLRWVSHAVGAGLGRRYPFVLCYHGVGEVAAADDPSGIFLSGELFARHLDVIADAGYELLTVSDLWRAVDSGPGALARGAISFDDGLVKTMRGAVAMLLDRGVPCSVYVPTGLMGRPHPDVNGELIASPEEIRELAQAGVEIGAHSVDHVALTGLGHDAALEQLRRSRATLEDLLGSPVKAMAYPFGAVDEQTMEVAEEAGYEVACAVSGAGPWRAMCLPREPVHASATPLRLRLKMAGLYGPVYAFVGDHGPLRGGRRRRTPG
jgi:peptidoglycan/xylan/chitin deacetylase (PgdA/CDA1 family)